MDISEIKDYKLSGDLLKLMFERQAEVERKFASVEGFKEHLVFGKIDNLHLSEVCSHINDKILWRLVQEINEAVIALKNGKTWRQSKYLLDVNEYLDEVADIFIYFMNLCFASGISPEKLTQLVLKKIKINEERISSKY